MTKKKTEDSFKFDITKIANAELLKEHNNVLKLNKTLLKKNQNLEKIIENRQKTNNKESDDLISLAIDLANTELNISDIIINLRKLTKKLETIENKPFKEIMSFIGDIQECIDITLDSEIQQIKKFESIVYKIASKYA